MKLKQLAILGLLGLCLVVSVAATGSVGDVAPVEAGPTASEEAFAPGGAGFPWCSCNPRKNSECPSWCNPPPE